jgi:hypothetical protein
MRLIDADALLNGGIRVQCGLNDNGLIMIPMGDVRKSIENAPTIDAVPVIRCKECKQWTGSKCKRFSFAPFAYCYTNPDDYCSRGERK